MRFTLIFIVLVSMVLFSCEKVEEAELIEPPVVAMYAAANQTDTTCEFYGSIEVEGDNAVLVKGFCWDTDTLPTLDDFSSEDGSGPGTFNTLADSLTPQTKYFVRAYAKTSIGTYYSQFAPSFRTY